MGLCSCHRAGERHSSVRTAQQRWGRCPSVPPLGLLPLQGLASTGHDRGSAWGFRPASRGRTRHRLGSWRLPTPSRIYSHALFLGSVLSFKRGTEQVAADSQHSFSSDVSTKLIKKQNKSMKPIGR